LYLGLGSVVQRTHPKFGAPPVNIGLTYTKQGAEPNGDAGDKYTGLDRFGRVVDQRWTSSDAVSSPLDRFQYGYDRDSNRLYRKNPVPLAGGFDELYHVSGTVDTYDMQGNPAKEKGTGTFNIWRQGDSVRKELVLPGLWNNQVAHILTPGPPFAFSAFPPQSSPQVEKGSSTFIYSGVARKAWPGPPLPSTYHPTIWPVLLVP